MYAYVGAASGWLDEHLKRFIQQHIPSTVFVDDINDIPEDATRVFQWCDGWELNRNFALLNKRGGLINAYPNSDALARKDHLAAVVDYWTAKRPNSILKNHVPHTIRLTLDYAEYVDESLTAADDLTLLYSLEDNDGKDARDREWWILKPALVDCGAGIRLFSTVDELASNLELAEYEDESSDEDTECTDDEPTPVTEKNAEDPFSPTLSIPGLDSLDGLITTTTSSPKPKSKTDNPLIRTKKPTYVFKEGGRIPSAQMRAFVAQRYIASIAPLENRKWHARAYVLSIGRLKVHVYREMLALLAGEDYQPPWENPSLKASLTNTALQDDDVVESRASMREFWSLQDDIFPGIINWKESIFEQICGITGELFRAAANVMADKFTTLDKCFELFAVDFMVDDTGAVWLLEVNETPAFYQSGIAGPLSLRLMETVVSVAMEHMGVTEGVKAEVRGRMVEVLDETSNLAKSNITEILPEEEEWGR